MGDARAGVDLSAVGEAKPSVEGRFAFASVLGTANGNAPAEPEGRLADRAGAGTAAVLAFGGGAPIPAFAESRFGCRGFAPVAVAEAVAITDVGLVGPAFAIALTSGAADLAGTVATFAGPLTALAGADAVPVKVDEDCCLARKGDTTRPVGLSG